MAAQRIGTIRGTFLAPGVSHNRRLYQGGVDGNIAKAVSRMQERLADPHGQPITMLSHHGAGDDSTRIAGRITKVTQTADGSAQFEADLADTAAGRDIAALTTPDNPYLSNVSIRAAWIGPVKSVNIDGRTCDTADDLEVDGVDFTKSPGVDAARIDYAALAEASDGLQRTVITESLEGAQVTIIEEAPAVEASDPKKPYGDVAYADPGYQTDGVSRYPLDTVKHIRAAWAYINQADNAKPYSAAQLKRIKGRVKAAAKKADIDIAAESQAVTAAVTEALEEAWASMNVDNGQGDVRVNGYVSDPSFLPQLGKKVAAAALAGLAALDPDNDGDIDGLDPDLATAGGEAAATQTPSDNKSSEANTEKEPTMGEPTKATPESLAAMTAENRSKALLAMSADERATALAGLSQEQVVEFATLQVTPAAPATGTTDPAKPEAPKAEEKSIEETKPERNLTDADLDALAARLKPATETTTATSESDDADKRITDAVEAAKKATLEEVGRLLGRRGVRRGLVPTQETSSPDKPLHEMTDEERADYFEKSPLGQIGR